MSSFELAKAYTTDQARDLLAEKPGSVIKAGGIDVLDHLKQHLASPDRLVDIKNVEADFLNSESRLADAMISVVRSAGLTLLSYHCHSLTPAGVSCVGVLLESHISFHTWPEEGVITLDLFTCGPKGLLPTIPDIETKFGIPRCGTGSATGTPPRGSA